MQTTSLPFPVSGANGLNAQTQNTRGNAVLNTGADFGATLTHQLEQRQLEQRQALAQPQRAPQAAVQPQPPVAARPQAPAPAKPAANEAKAPAREAAKEPARDAAQADAAQAASDSKTAAEGKDDQDASASPDAKAADSVADMLAMLASFHQPAQAATPVVAEESAAGALQAALKGKPGLEDGKHAVKLEGDAVLAAVTEEPQDKAAPGIDLRALDLARAGEQSGKPQLESGQFASKLQDSMAQAAALKETAAAPEGLTNLVAQTNALQTAQAAGAVPADRLSARVGTPAWDNQVGQKVIWMVGGEEQSATLELNPPDLGPVQVVLNVSNEMASVTFSAQQLEVRQALENSLPRLREMMSESGIALGNATVNAGSDGSPQQNQQGSSRPGRGGNGGDGDSAVADTAPRQRTGVLGGAGAVDTFA